MDLLREPSILLGTLVAGAWYWRGSRRTALRAVGRRARRRVPWRGISFATGLVTIVAALDSPLERLADDLFWAHMLQHVLLMLVAAPLIVLGAPWLPFWRPLPLGLRRTLARGIAKSPSCSWLRRVARVVARPRVTWILFNGDLAAWHVPAAYELTLRSGAVHYAEHVSFLVLGMLFWIQLLDSTPFRAQLAPFGRVVYVAAGSVASWLLAVVLMLATSPFYPAQYAGHHGISALADQQIAAGVMLGPGSIPYAIVVFYWLYVWLGADEPRPRRAARRAPLESGAR
jgi:putative membrane protein